MSDYTLPDGHRLRVYDHGGIDVQIDGRASDGDWITVALTPDACAELARVAMIAVDAAAGTVRGGRVSS